jgi:hypothetical protein
MLTAWLSEKLKSSPVVELISKSKLVLRLNQTGIIDYITEDNNRA